MTDHFAEDRRRMEQALEWISDAGVTFGEFAADNLLGDPGLREAIRAANVASQACQAAAFAGHAALEALPQVERAEPRGRP